MSEQPKVNEAKKRLSRIQKSVRRTFNLGNYQSLEIVTSYDEDVEWLDLKERDAKTANLTKLLTKDFLKTTEDVFKELNLNEVSASIIDNKEKSKNNLLDEVL